MPKKLTVNKNPEKREITGGQSAAQLGNQIRDLKSRVPDLIPIESIPIMEVFKDLFPMKSQNREAIAESIQKNGFDPKKAVLIGNFPDGSRSLVDGYTRRAGSLDAALTDIYAWNQDFESIDAAIDWALHEQLDRRNLSESETYEFVLKIDQVKGKGRKTNEYRGKSAIKTAELVGTSPRKVERIRTVEKLATPEQKKAIHNGEKSVYRVYQEIKENAPNGANSPKPEKNWIVEVRGSSVVLDRKGEILPLVNFTSMETLYGAPSGKIRAVVEKYLEKVL